MEYEIIYTDDYALIVSDEKIENGKYYIHKQIGVFRILQSVGSSLPMDAKKVIAHRPLTDAPILEGVSLLPEFSQEDDVEDLSLAYASSKGHVNPEGYSDKQVGLLHGFIDGYNKAKETYRFSEDDLRKALLIKHDGLSVDYVIQSLQQPKRPKYFNCKMEPKYKHIGAVKGIYGSGFRKQNLMYGLPKTVTNSQGQTELVGSYIY